MLTRFLIADIPFAPRGHGGRAARDPSKGLSGEAHHYYFTSRAQGSAKINADRPHKLWKLAGWEAAKRTPRSMLNRPLKLWKFAGWEGGKAQRAPAQDAKLFNLSEQYSIELQL